MHAHTTVKRSVAKALSFRVIAVIVGFTIAYIFTQDFIVSISIFTVHATAATILYFIHERVWDKIEWGIKRED